MFSEVEVPVRGYRHLTCPNSLRFAAGRKHLRNRIRPSRSQAGNRQPTWLVHWCRMSAGPHHRYQPQVGSGLTHPDRWRDRSILTLNNVAVVTGASSGIGRATAIELARRGAWVFVHGYRNEGGLAQTVDDLRAMGKECASSCGDLGNHDVQDQLLEEAWQWSESCGRELMTWVNLAGADVLTGDASHQSFEQKLAQLWQIDVEATIRLSRRAGARMRRGGGCLVNIGWDQAAWGMEGESGELFATVKGAVMAFTRSLAKSLAPDVRVNCVAPGWIKTKWGQDASEKWQQRATTESLLKRWGEPDDVARLIGFLASDQAAFINGQVLQVNGGFAGGGEDAGP